MIATGETEGRVTYLDWVKDPDSLNTADAAMTATINGELLHRRYGHPGRSRFQMLLETAGLENVSSSNDTCETCVQAKKVKSQSHESIHRAPRALMRVYIDIWGPY